MVITFADIKRYQLPSLIKTCFQMLVWLSCCPSSSLWVKLDFPDVVDLSGGFKRYEVRVKWYLWHLRGYFRLRGHSWTSTLPQISGKKASVCWFKVHLIRTRQNSTEFSNRELSWVQFDIFHLALIPLREDLINVWSQSWPGVTSELSNNK